MRRLLEILSPYFYLGSGGRGREGGGPGQDGTCIGRENGRILAPDEADSTRERCWYSTSAIGEVGGFE
jgi:hypothetical protein